MRQSAALKVQPNTTPTTISGTVVPFPGVPAVVDDVDEVSRRTYLTEREVDQLCDAARKRGRYGHRDATMILIAYRHGPRVSELVALR